MRKLNRVGGAYVIEACFMKDVFDTLTSAMTEITAELCN